MLEGPSASLKAFQTVVFVIPFEQCRLFKVSHNLSLLVFLLFSRYARILEFS